MLVQECGSMMLEWITGAIVTPRILSRTVGGVCRKFSGSDSDCDVACRSSSGSQCVFRPHTPFHNFNDSCIVRLFMVYAKVPFLSEGHVVGVYGDIYGATYEYLRSSWLTACDRGWQQIDMATTWSRSSWSQVLSTVKERVYMGVESVYRYRKNI